MNIQTDKIPSKDLLEAETPETKDDQETQTDEEELKKYLNDTLVPLLAFGLDELEKVRPSDPVLFLAHFLLRYNPKKSYQ